MNMDLKKTSLSAAHICFMIGLIYGPIMPTNGSESEYYSSVAGLETLLKTEQILLNDLKEYVASTQQSVALLENEISAIANEHKLAANDVDNYLTNPVNAYKLIKRLHNDWKMYRQHIEEGNNFLRLMDERMRELNYPTQDDLVESALALVRLQSTYNLDIAQVASGILNGVKYGNEMSWSDCLLLGEQLISARSYNQTKLWIKESARRYNNVETKANETYLDFMELLGENLLRIGDIEGALQVFETVLNRNPKRLNDLADIYDNTRMLPHDYEEDGDYHNSNEFKLYEKVCREEVTRSPAEERDLRCRYHAPAHCAYCLLAPYKLEELNIDPYVVIFHNMISDKVINYLKNVTLPHMGRSMVRGYNGTGPSKRSYRVSKNAWLPYAMHPYTMKMLSNLHDVTGLNMNHSEHLQVANYGLGGHYEPHFDFILNATVGLPSNRISTSIFYLSDVEQGGATAFPFLKFAVKPTKGNVLFWYNLHRSLDGDYRTKHAGCPVLKGSKWIANVWTHDIKQDASRPCAWYRDHESSLEYASVN